MFMTIVTTLIVGLIIGSLARALVPGKQPMAWWLTMLVGVVGATLGTLSANALGVGGSDTQFDFAWINWAQFALQLLLASVLVLVVSRLGLFGAKKTSGDTVDN